MKKSINIFISFENAFFTYGVKIILEDYFSTKGIKPHFHNNASEISNTDIILLDANHDYTKVRYSFLFDIEWAIPYFPLATENHKIHKIINKTGRGAIFYISQKIMVKNLIKLIDKVNLVHSNMHMDNSVYRYKTSLTKREKEIINQFFKGKSNVAISQKFGLSVTTVSQHKRNAMRRLNLRNNNELHSWLLSGGLNKII